MFKKKYLKLLSGHLINKKINFYKDKQNENDILFRFEYEGSYLKEYYTTFEDALLIVKVNKGNLIHQSSNVMVYSLANQTLCVVKT